MGGRSFLDRMQGAKFPRMDGATYCALRDLNMEHLRRIFLIVVVPREAPEKPDYGDLDFIVSNPIAGSCTLDDLRTLTGAVQGIKNGPVFNLAIPLPSSPKEKENEAQQLYYQMDVTECKDEHEVSRFVHFQGYGDLGMILGLVARANGLSLGLHGLKIPKVNEFNMEPYTLSDDFLKIFEFFDLDLRRWEAGFPTIISIFEWVATSKLYDPNFLRESQHRAHRRRDRKMFQKFLEWVETQRQETDDKDIAILANSAANNDVVEAAKVFFNKKEDYEARVESEHRRRQYKENFNGRLVIEWTGLQGKQIKLVMDEVRKTAEESQIGSMSREEIKGMVLETWKRMRDESTLW